MTPPTTAAAAAIRQQARRVHVLRCEEQGRHNYLEGFRQQWEQGHDEQITALARTQRELRTAEAELRRLALEAYDADPTNKKPGPGVGIRESTGLVYLDTKALAWAISHTMALALDRKTFEQIVKSMPIPPDCVVIRAVVTATIAADLAKALED